MPLLPLALAAAQLWVAAPRPVQVPVSRTGAPFAPARVGADTAPPAAVRLDSLAAHFGVPHLGSAEGNANSTMTIRHWIPAGETFDHWTRMMTVITVALPPRPAAADSAMQILIASRIEQMHSLTATLIPLDTTGIPVLGPALYAKFDLRGGLVLEHAATVIYRAGRDLGLSITFARRDRPLSPREVASVRALVDLPPPR